MEIRAAALALLGVCASRSRKPKSPLGDHWPRLEGRINVVWCRKRLADWRWPISDGLVGEMMEAHARFIRGSDPGEPRFSTLCGSSLYLRHADEPFLNHSPTQGGEGLESFFFTTLLPLLEHMYDWDD